MRQKPFLPGDENLLRKEFQNVSRVQSLWDQSPDSAQKLEDILHSLKDPFHAIALLKDGRTLKGSELFTLGHLAFSVNRALMVLNDTYWVPWPARCVPPSLQTVEKRLMPGSSGQPSFYVADSYSAELAKARAQRKQKERQWRYAMDEEAQAVEDLLGKRPGLREEIAVRKSDRRLVEKARLMPELGEIRETLTHVHFRLKASGEAVTIEREISRLRQRELALEEEVMADLSRELRPTAESFERAAWALGELDWLLCKAHLAREWDAVVPQVLGDAGVCLQLEGAIHPIVREIVQGRGGRFQPVSISLSEPVTVITGPNMGGKTVALQILGLMVTLAQWGFLVPCTSMSFSLFDFVYLQPQSPGKPGLSSFAAEIVALKEPLAMKGQKGLILLDEIGRGTNPSQGMALYAALLQYLGQTEGNTSRVVATTHYHGLTRLIPAEHWQVAGLRLSPERDMPGDNGDPESGLQWLYEHMDYGLQKVGPETPAPRDALLVASLLGLDREIIEIAESFCRP
ncbi:MAG: MutS-related protein [Bacillota bacterium]